MPTGYPEDPQTDKNAFVAKLNGNNPDRRIGPSLVLKVKSGDTVRLGARAFYKSQGPGKAQKTTAPAADMAAALVRAFGNPGATIAEGHGAGQGAEGTPFNNNFVNDSWNRMKERDPKSPANPDRPKAYLNFVLFDEDFNLVDGSSGVKQVAAQPDELQTLAQDNVIMEKSGFLYVYTSNETPQDVFFDNLTVALAGTPVLEETHYYPFGLTMAGISEKAVYKPENRFKYNGIELNKDLDLYSYEAQYRNLDPQLGRWWQVDPKPNVAISPYASMENNPILNADPLGDTIIFHPSATKEFQQAFYTAALRLLDRGQGKELAQLFFSEQTYVIKEFEGTNGQFQGNFIRNDKGEIIGGDGGTISWNPSIGKETETGAFISPTTVLNHEFDHAAQFDKKPMDYVNDARTPDSQYGNKEEKRVIAGSEQRTARGLNEIGPGQVTRRSHEFKNQILVDDPRSNKGMVINPYYNLAPVQITSPKKKK